MKYFGTDGIRGKVPDVLNEELCFKIGRAVAECFGGTCLIGRDSRISGEALLKAFALGALSGKMQVLDGGVIPTPAVSYLVRRNGYTCGAVVSASHNPPEFNGVKLFCGGGVKLSGEQELKIEQLIDSPPRVQFKTITLKTIDARAAYTDFLIANGEDLAGINVRLDAGFGAVGSIASDVFFALKASTRSFNTAHDGSRINVDCGALHPDFVARHTLNAVGFSFDGDGDRVAFSTCGKVLDGDSVLHTFSRIVALKDEVVVGTVMANSALKTRLESEGRRLIRTNVGDKNIAALMLKNGYNLGGEQSGHYIIYPDCVSGDGIFAALKLAYAHKRGLVSQLDLLPQKTISVPFGTPRLHSLETEYRPRLTRLLMRKSGTEPYVRVMAEGEEIVVEDFINKVKEAANLAH